MTTVSPDWLRWPQTQSLLKAIQPDALRFVGGCVRDTLLKRPVSDVDGATPLPPQETMRRLQAAGIKAIPTGIAHGTVTAVVAGHPFEITTLRRDVATDGRHATIAFTGNWEEDAARRDFTMNALYCDASGALYDYFGGKEDALAGIVRFIGVAGDRIAEDALRILRFFRFFAHYGIGQPDGTGLEACARHAGLLGSLSGERIAREMLRLLTAGQAGAVVDILQAKGIWPQLLPAHAATLALHRLPGALEATRSAPDGILALACLLRGTDAPAANVATVAARWKLSRAQHKRLEVLCNARFSCAAYDEKAIKKSIRTMGKADFIDHTLLAMAEGGDAAAGSAAITLARDWNMPLFPVSGDDLLALGMRPGKDMGERLKALEAQWEESGYSMGKKELLAVCVPTSP